ncbi:MAG: hypothetical protein HY394_02565 [Candidatus Diapherotrites archaeon]|nr:hypothetical protein [Candidatus Diapherotrites archaeon]
MKKFDKSNIKKKINKIIKIAIKLSAVMIAGLVTLAIFAFILRLIPDINRLNEFAEYFVLWEAAIVVSTTFSLLSFEFSRAVNEKKQKTIATESGKNFFTSTILFIFGLIFFNATIYLSTTEFNQSPLVKLMLLFSNQVIVAQVIFIAKVILAVAGLGTLAIASWVFSTGLLNLANKTDLLDLT